MASPQSRPLLLVVDDVESILVLVRRVAEQQEFEVITASGGREAIALAASRQPDLALVDLEMPEVGGLEVIRAIRSANPQTRVALMTGHSSMESAVEAIQLGAMDYIAKPFDLPRLKETLARVIEETALLERVSAAEDEIARVSVFCGMIGRSPAMRQVFDLLRRLAPHVRSALITGETGTGKELAAAALHQLGPRRSKRFLTLNCSAIVETLFESELFGHVRGAFTGAIENKTGLFETADGGTIFLDEIGELSMPLQAKLLRVLESGEVMRVGAAQSRKVDVRVIAATNRNLLAEVAAGRFREDLYYRLNIAEIHLPSLRERVADVGLLTSSFLATFSKQFDVPKLSVTAGAAAALEAYDWPGNVRQLRNTLERATLIAEGALLTDEHILKSIVRAAGPAGAATVAAVPEAVTRLDDVESQHVARVVAECGGNKSKAARKLGISRWALYRRMGLSAV